MGLQVFSGNGYFNSIPKENSIYLCITLDAVLDVTVENHLSKFSDLIVCVCVCVIFVKLS